jgi:hypothetical protein
MRRSPHQATLFDIEKTRCLKDDTGHELVRRSALEAAHGG